MSETKRPVLTPAKSGDDQQASKTEQALPAGQCHVHVAIPNMIGTGDSKRPFADPLEKIAVTEKNAAELELRELAFRDETEAQSKHAMWKRKREAQEKAALEAAQRRVRTRAAQLLGQ